MSRGWVEAEPRFLTDRMLGTLTRYLRFMGYDTKSASTLAGGDNREDTSLLKIALSEGRILLTRDRELARRGGEHAIWISSEEVIDQVRQLALLGLITPEIRMSRCSLCNGLLRPARRHEVEAADYAPQGVTGLAYYWCPGCRKLYWMGSHGDDLMRRLGRLRESLENRE